jgi:hypothetical protein
MITLNVPEPGNYVVIAKVRPYNSIAGYAHVKCGITATAGGSSSYDEAGSQLMNGYNEQVLSMHLVHNFFFPGKVDLTCIGTGDGVKASGIRITAFKVGEASTINAPVNPGYHFVIP